MLIPIRVGGGPQEKMHLLGMGEKQLTAGMTITVRSRETGGPQQSLRVEAVERYGDGRLRLVRAEEVEGDTELPS